MDKPPSWTSQDEGEEEKDILVRAMTIGNQNRMTTSVEKRSWSLRLPSSNALRLSVQS